MFYDNLSDCGACGAKAILNMDTNGSHEREIKCSKDCGNTWIPFGFQTPIPEVECWNNKQSVLKNNKDKSMIKIILVMITVLPFIFIIAVLGGPFYALCVYCGEREVAEPLLDRVGDTIADKVSRFCRD